MAKIALMGAGSATFSRRLLGDLLRWPELQDSEFRWIEGDAAHRTRCASFPLVHVPPERAGSAHAVFRDAFMTLARWVPDYFETRAGFRALRIDPDADVDEWTIAAGAAHAGEVDRFSFVHVMVFRPLIEDAHGAAADGAARLGRLRAGLSLGYRRRRHVSITYVPGKEARETRPWHVGSDADPYRGVAPATADTAALARALQSSWLDRLTKDIWHG